MEIRIGAVGFRLFGRDVVRGPHCVAEKGGDVCALFDIHVDERVCV